MSRDIPSNQQDVEQTSPERDAALAEWHQQRFREANRVATHALSAIAGGDIYPQKLAREALDLMRGAGETTARLPTVEFMSGYVSARTDKAHWLGLLNDWFRHHANARGTDGRLLHPDLDVETQRELLKAESPPKTSAEPRIDCPHNECKRSPACGEHCQEPL